MSTATTTVEPAGLAVMLSELFVGRSSRTARLAMREQGFQTEGYGLSLRECGEHVAGHTRFGVIPFVDAEHVGWACIDLDVTKWGLGPDSPEALEIVNGIIDALGEYGIHAVLERSQLKGWHVWIFFDQPAPAAAVRALLRRVALDAGAHDEADLICPRQDRLGGTGNGTWLPLFGGDTGGCTRFWTIDPESMQWTLAADQAAIIEELLRYPTPAEVIPPAQGNGADTSHAPMPGDEEHPCDWITDELAEHGVTLQAVVLGKDKLQFRCPLHVADHPRTHGGSAVFFSSGSGWCASSRCNRRWRTVTEFLDLLGVEREHHGARSEDDDLGAGGSGSGSGRERDEGESSDQQACDDLVARLRPLSHEQVEGDVIPEAVVEGWIYNGLLTLLSGGAKQGKSVLAAQAAVCVAAGVPFLDLAVAKGRVLYLCGEMTAAMLRDRIVRIAETLGVPTPSWSEELLLVAPTACSGFPRLSLAESVGREAVRRLIEEFRPALLIVDTLYKFLPGVEVGEPAVGESLSHLAGTGRVLSCAPLVLDHSPKAVTTGEAGSTPATASYGSVFKGASAAVASHLRRDGQGWKIDAEGWLPTWAESIHYAKAAGDSALGCVRTTATEARGVDLVAIYRVFAQHGSRNPDGGLAFESRRQFEEALGQAKLAGSSRQSRITLASKILHDHAADAASGAARYCQIVTTSGARGALHITLKADSVRELEDHGGGLQ